MSDPNHSDDNGDTAKTLPRRPINWDAVAAVIAALIGLLAVLVSAYEVRSVRHRPRGSLASHHGRGGRFPARFHG